METPLIYFKLASTEDRNITVYISHVAREVLFSICSQRTNNSPSRLKAIKSDVGSLCPTIKTCGLTKSVYNLIQMYTKTA